MTHTLKDIEALAAQTEMARGQAAFARGDVVTLDVQRGGRLITAILRRPGHETIRVYVRVTEARGKCAFYAECSCQRPAACEHVVAVLLAAHDRNEALPDFEATGSERSGHDAAASSLALAYRLRIEQGVLTISPVVALPPGAGNYSGHRFFDPGNARRANPPRFLTPADLDVLRALDRHPRSPRGAVMLDGPDASELLVPVLATGRVDWVDEHNRTTRLRPGPARHLLLTWACAQSGDQHLVPTTDPASTLLLPIDTRWYLDADSGECGALISELSMDAVNGVLAYPVIAPGEVDATCRAIAAAWPGQAVPLPRRFVIETLPPVRPVPCLHLVTEVHMDENGISTARDYARLAFDYVDTEFPGEGSDTRLIDGRVVQARRDRRFERDANRALSNAGLAYQRGARDDDPGHFTPWLIDTPDPAQVWIHFLSDGLPVLRDQGWRIIYDDFRFQLAEVNRWTGRIERLPENDWFSVGLGVEVDGERVDLLPLLIDAFGELPFDRVIGESAGERLLVPFTGANGASRLLSLPIARLAPVLHTLLELFGRDKASDGGSICVSRVQLARLSALDSDDSGAASPLHWRGDADARQLMARLRDLDGISAVAPPADLQAELRPYQQDGLNWLQFLREYGFGGILADDMGLGKTLQALAHLLIEKASGRADRPSLVVAPTSLMFNWHAEAKRFAPGLSVLVLHGPQRKAGFKNIARHDLVLTTYPLLARDQAALLAQPFHLLILDEAQVIKNPKAQAGAVVRRIEARHRIGLSGTPMENHLGELWSLFDALLPGLLADRKTFGRLFRTPIEKHGDDAVAERLRRRVRPFLLRRSKQEVAAELPDKTEIVHRVELDGRQRELYETVRLSMHRRVREEIERQGLARSHIVVLDALLKLRQVCCDPRLVDSKHAHAVGASAKLEALMAMLPEMVEEGRRILLFSQFTAMLKLIEAAVSKAGIDFVKLTGRTRDRQSPVQRFQNGEVPLFLISLKAGGVGLNLTAADTVIHYDPWWNPAVERQATDRAHRIGQRQAVFVYKFICAGTVEEKIQAMQQRKQALAEGLYETGGEQRPQWRSEDIDELFAPLEPSPT